MEQWRDIAGYEGLYQVSDQGRIFSNLSQRVLEPGLCTNGYLAISLGRKARHLVHRLVAFAFVDGDQSLEVNHKNGLRSDNRACNLEWVTRSDNHRHSYRELSRKKHSFAEPVVGFSLSDETILMFRR